MDILTRIWNGLTGKAKWVNIPDIVGGTGIFRGLSFLDTWSLATRMGAYKKSLYVYACVTKIAQKVGSIDWKMKKIKNSRGETVEVPIHEALDLLYRPNPFQTKGEFYQRYMINKKLAGAAFILKVRNGAGKVVELWNLRPDYMRVLLDPQEVIKGYEFQGEGKSIVFAPEDIIYDAYPDPLSDFGGLSPLQPAQSRVDTEEFATKYQRYFFENNARPDFLLLSDKKISAEQKDEMRASWDKRHKGEKNSGKGAFLEGGMKYQQVSISQREMDYIESLKMTRDDILVAFGVPKPIVAITDDVNLANAKTAMEIFLSETIVPEITQLTEKLNEHLIYPEFGDQFFVEFVSPVKENQTEKADIQAKRIASGTLLINEAREEWGDQPLKGGNTLYIPFGMQPVGGLPTEGGKEFKTVAVLGDEKDPYTMRKNEDHRGVFRGRSKAFKRVRMVETIERMILRQMLKDELVKDEPKKPHRLIKDEVRGAYGDMVVKAIDQRGRKFAPAITDFMEDQKKRLVKALGFDKGVKAEAGKIEQALEEWAGKESGVAAAFSLPYITEFVEEAGNEAMRLVAPAEDFAVASKRVQAFLKSRSKQFGRVTTTTTLEKLSATLGEGIAADEGIAKLVDRIDGVYEDFDLYRSQLIARTEATAANNKGFMEAYEQSGVANAKEWIATGDDRTRDSHASTDGEVVGVDEEFSNGLDYPGDASGGPEETVNCRCVLGPAFIEK